MRLYLVRHGQTIANAERRFQGHKDYPLSDVGLQQANSLAERFKQVRLDYIYSSDLGRAVETAKHINQHHRLRIQKDQRLREFCWGVFDGLTLAEAEEKYPHVFLQPIDDWSQADIPEKEELEQLLLRASMFWQEMHAQHSNERILVVSHARFLNSLMAKILRFKDQNMWAFKFLNASVTVVDSQHPLKPIIKVFNDVGHVGCTEIDKIY